MTTEAKTIHVGIDIGTTSAKICAKRGNEVILENKEIYEGEELEEGIQDPKVILRTALDLLQKTKNKINDEQLTISDIWTCGQMHGIVFWNQDSIRDLGSLIVSSLYNWTYSTPEICEFLKTLPKWKCAELHPGFGLVTFSYLYKSDPKSLKKYNRCGTIMDLFLSLLTQSSETFISHHNAHSWGYCTSDATWQTDVFPVLPDWIRLPTIKSDNSDFVGYYDDIKCHVASGDLQASVASLEYFENTAYMILGTSAQLCCFVNKEEIPTTVIPPTVVQLPYSESKKLLAACSMNGGNALESIMKMYFPESYTPTTLCKLLDELDNTIPSIQSEIKIEPIFIPERESTKKLSIQNFNADIKELQILEATHRGIIENLFSLFPIVILEQLNITALALVGSAQCPRFRRHVEKIAEKRFRLITANSLISTPLGATNFLKS